MVADLCSCWHLRNGCRMKVMGLLLVILLGGVLNGGGYNPEQKFKTKSSLKILDASSRTLTSVKFSCFILVIL